MFAFLLVVAILFWITWVALLHEFMADFFFEKNRKQFKVRFYSPEWERPTVKFVRTRRYTN